MAFLPRLLALFGAQSSCCCAAVENERRACHVSSRVRREKGDHLGDIAGPAVVAHRNVWSLRFRIGPGSMTDRSGCDAIDGDPVAPDFERQGASQHGHCRFRSRIGSAMLTRTLSLEVGRYGITVN